jgi:hypothetical protein
VKRAGQRGLSLVEALVALTLSIVMLVVGTALLVQMLRDAQRHAGRAPSVGGATDLALALIERDVRQAVGVGIEDAALVVVLESGERVGYVRDGTELARLTRAAGAESERSHVLVRQVNVATFEQDGRVVDVWLGVGEEDLRHRTVLARNAQRPGGLPGTRGGPMAPGGGRQGRGDDGGRGSR